jgi:selenocysteine lyase/cysteine desulfurase
MDIIREEEQELTRLALEKMSQIPGLTIYGIKSPGSKGFERKGGVIVFSLKNIMGNALANKLAARGGIGTRYGCHCAHLIVKHILNVSPGLERFQHFMLTILPQVQLPGVARVSLGLENTREDVDKFIQVLEMIATRQRLNPANEPDIKKASFKSRMHDFIGDIEEKVYFRDVKS